MGGQFHIFICHSALSLDGAVRICSEFDARTLSRVRVLKFFPGTRGKIPVDIKIDEMFPCPDDYSEWSRPFHIATFFSAWLEKLELEGVGELVVYIPHPFELPGNYFAFSDSRVSALELLPDGLLNYVSRSLYPESLSRAVRLCTRIGLRLAASAIVGLPYRPFARGHLTQFERKIYSSYWIENDEGYITRSGTRKNLPPCKVTLKSTRKAEPGRVLIIDQEIGQLFDSELERGLRAELRAEIERLRPLKLFYKSHPRGRNRVVEFSAQAAEDISGPELAERLIVELQIGTVLGFYSTPLLSENAGKGPQKIAILPNPNSPGIRQKRLLKELRCVFEKSGVRLVAPR